LLIVLSSLYFQGLTFDLQPQDELISDTRSYLRRRQRQPALVSRYFQEPHVAYCRRRMTLSAICLPP